MRAVKLFFITLSTLFLLSGCDEHSLLDYYDEHTFDVVNMKVGSDTELSLYLDEEYPHINYVYNYAEMVDYYLPIGRDTYSEIYLEDRYNDTYVEGRLRQEDQTMVIFGADAAHEDLGIEMQVRMFQNERPKFADAVTINLINALPTENFSNFLPYLGFESTLFLEVNGQRVSREIDYMQNDRFTIRGVDYSGDYVSVMLVLSDGSAQMFDLYLRNGHSYNLIVGHAANTLYSEPRIYTYEVSY